MKTATGFKLTRSTTYYIQEVLIQASSSTTRKIFQLFNPKQSTASSEFTGILCYMYFTCKQTFLEITISKWHLLLLKQNEKRKTRNIWEGKIFVERSCRHRQNAKWWRCWCPCFPCDRNEIYDIMTEPAILNGFQSIWVHTRNELATFIFNAINVSTYRSRIQK